MDDHWSTGACRRDRRAPSAGVRGQRADPMHTGQRGRRLFPHEAIALARSAFERRTQRLRADTPRPDLWPNLGTSWQTSTAFSASSSRPWSRISNERMTRVHPARKKPGLLTQGTGLENEMNDTPKTTTRNIWRCSACAEPLPANSPPGRRWCAMCIFPAVRSMRERSPRRRVRQ